MEANTLVILTSCFPKKFADDPVHGMPSKFDTCPHLGVQGLLRAVASHEDTQPEEQSLEFVTSRMLLEDMVSKQIMRYDGWLIRTADEMRVVKK